MLHVDVAQLEEAASLLDGCRFESYRQQFFTPAAWYEFCLEYHADVIRILSSAPISWDSNKFQQDKEISDFTEW